MKRLLLQHVSVALLGIAGLSCDIGIDTMENFLPYMMDVSAVRMSPGAFVVAQSRHALKVCLPNSELAITPVDRGMPGVIILSFNGSRIAVPVELTACSFKGKPLDRGAKIYFRHDLGVEIMPKLVPPVSLGEGSAIWVEPNVILGPEAAFAPIQVSMQFRDDSSAYSLRFTVQRSRPEVKFPPGRRAPSAAACP